MSSEISRFCWIAGKFLASLTIFFSTIIFFGWFTGYSWITEIYTGAISMKINTAIGIALLSSSLLLLYNNKFTISRVITFIPAVIAAISLFEDITSYNLHIDELIIKDIGGWQKKEVNPGRLATLSSVLFLFCCIGLWLDTAKKMVYKQIAQGFFGLVTILCTVLILGYLFEVHSFTHFNFSSPVAFPTAICLLMISVSGAFLNPDVGYLTIFTGSKIGNIMVRKLLLQIIGITVLLGYLRLQSFKYNLFSNEFGLIVTILIFMLIVSIIISSIGLKLNQIEDSRNYAEKKFSKVLESTPNGILIVDKDGKIKMVNKQSEELFGYSKSEMLGKSIEILIPDKYKTPHVAYRKTYADNATKRNMGGNKDLFALHKQGHEVPVLVGLNSLDMKEEKVVIASVIDISERKRKQKIIDEQFIELQSKNRDIEQFIYIASHDLQEPLRTVRNYIGLIREDYPLIIDGDFKDYLANMDSAAERMSNLIKHLLQYGKLGSRSVATLIDSQKIAEEVISDLNSLIQSTSATIYIETQLPELTGFETEFRQLFQNLIHNAIKFRKQNELPVVAIGYDENAEIPYFYIKDNGIGIEERHFESIFRMFRKINSDSLYEGYGVGLTNCKKIVELHRGIIWIDSTLGQGTTIKFTTGLLEDLMIKKVS